MCTPSGFLSCEHRHRYIQRVILAATAGGERERERSKILQTTAIQKVADKSSCVPYIPLSVCWRPEHCSQSQRTHNTQRNQQLSPPSTSSVHHCSSALASYRLLTDKHKRAGPSGVIVRAQVGDSRTTDYFGGNCFSYGSCGRCG